MKITKDNYRGKGVTTLLFGSGMGMTAGALMLIVSIFNAEFVSYGWFTFFGSGVIYFGIVGLMGNNKDE